VLLAGVNRGDYVADIASGAVQGPAGDALNLLLTLFGNGVLDPGGNPNTDAKAAVAQLTTAGCDAFNAKYPDDPNVAYFSIAGRTENGGGDADCGSGREAPFDGSGAPAPTNDGLVTVASAKWGTFLGCVPADHLSEVCQIGGQSSGSSFDCVTLFRDLADWLVARGF
jgi:triacylglycerol esterase/lipase EstA (alpha/beta hydrolase family)